jgi:pimeloyl-[acyl-carrier protein] methyl ester esterase
VAVRYLSVAGLTLPYTVRGQGPAALLVHGYAHSHQMWDRPVQRYLRHHYRCYGLDLPGHGRASKPGLDWFTIDRFTDTLEQFCDRLGLDKFLLIGYSMGGMISMNLALRRPERVTNLITINAPVDGHFLGRYDPLLRLERLARRQPAEKLFRLYNRYPWLAVPAQLNRYANPKMIFSPSCRRVQTELGQCTVQTLFGTLKAIRTCDLRPRLADLRPPMLVITGDKDRVVPPAQARYISQQVKQARLVVIPNCGHLPLDEQPAPFDAALKSYLALPQGE